MRRNIFAALLLAMPATAFADPAGVTDTSFKDADGHRVQQLSAIVPAPLSEVWKAFTTDDGFKRWAVPMTHITLGNDGMMESSYSIASRVGDPDNIKNRIVAYLPEKLLVLQNAHVPKGGPFDPVLIATLRTIITFDAVDGAHTKVTEAQVGYGDGAGYDSMYQHFRAGNAYALQSLVKSFISGPVDWKAEAEAMNKSVDKTKTQ
jgi:uncharacterized protein YndB with AHSA1/START domain